MKKKVVRRDQLRKGNELSFDQTLASAGVTAVDVSKFFYFRSMISPDLVSRLIDETNEIIKSTDSPDWSDRLAGQIYDGRQLEIEPFRQAQPAFKELFDTIGSSGRAYAIRYAEKLSRLTNGREPPADFNPRVLMNDMWVVSQKAHDYNPPHDHRTMYPSGLSGVLYLKVPDQIDGKTPDGLFQFTWGPSAHHNLDHFTYSDGCSILPQPGLFLLFPKYLQHQVYPFRGSGERRCIAFNVNIVSDEAKNA